MGVRSLSTQTYVYLRNDHENAVRFSRLELFDSPSAYFENDGSSGFLLQDAWEAEGLQVRVGVIDEACVVVREQSLDVVEHKAKLVDFFDRLLVGSVLQLQRRGETADGGRVQDFAHLKRKQVSCQSCTSDRLHNLTLLKEYGDQNVHIITHNFSWINATSVVFLST